MYYNEGIKSFFKGIIPSSFLSLYGVIIMYSYENITYMLGYKSAVSHDITFDSMIAPFIIGGLSNSIT